MSLVRCHVCARTWDAARAPLCPSCLAARWLATPNLIREKHDPGVAPARLDTYRSIVTPRLITQLREVLEYAAVHGSWYLDTGYRMLVHVTPNPLGRAPGVGIPAGRREPEHALDCLFVAEADSAESAHIFAVDGERHQAQVRAGLFVPQGACDREGCSDLAAPGEGLCLAHGAGAFSARTPPEAAAEARVEREG